MGLLNAVLLWLHFAALALGGAATFGLPAVGAQMPSADASGRASLVKALLLLSKLGGVAVGLLIVTGVLMVWTRFGGPQGLPNWFWVKMVLVAAFIVVIVFSRRNAAKAMAGDREAAALQPRFGLASMAMLLAIVLTAVLTFA